MLGRPRDRVEAIARTTWLVLWALWGVIEIIGWAIFTMTPPRPGLIQIGVTPLLCFMVPAHITTLCVLGLRRSFLEKQSPSGSSDP